MSTDSVADDELAAFVDRILRMKSEEDAIKSDIKEIYAEAHGRGYDKTRLGETVTKVRKREKDADGEDEKEAIRDLYLTAYYRSKNKPHAHAYARGSAQAWKNESMSAGLASLPNEADETSSVENEAAEISTPIQPEAATSFADVEAHGAEANDSDSNAVALVPATQDGSADTGGEDVDAPDVPATHEHTDCALDVAGPAGKPVEASASAAPAPITYPAPGIVVMETTPPEGAIAHPYAACWPVRDIDVLGGVREPIVKIGKLILDGRGRMFVARGVNGGKGIAYPVVQYDGTDPLMDCIRWNMASRPNLHPHNLKIIAQKLVKEAPDRADEIHAAMGLVDEVAV